MSQLRDLIKTARKSHLEGAANSIERVAMALKDGETFQAERWEQILSTHALGVTISTCALALLEHFEHDRGMCKCGHAISLHPDGQECREANCNCGFFKQTLQQ